jgi:hypothetical protein
MNFFSLSSSSLNQEMLSDVNTNQYGLELPKWTRKGIWMSNIVAERMTVSNR